MSRRADINNAKIKTYTGEKLVNLEYHDQGADGVVYKGCLEKHENETLAIKFYIPIKSVSIFTRPTILPNFVEDLEKRYKNELDRLRYLSHPNLQRYYSCGTFSYSRGYFADFNDKIEQNSEIGFIASRYVTGKRLDEIINSEREESNRIVSYLADIADAMLYLHKNRMMHGDIQLPNIIISKENDSPVLIDFGLSKGFTKNDDELTQLFLNSQPIPTTIQRGLEEIENQHGKEVPRAKIEKLLFPYLDLYRFGSLIDEIIKSPCAKKMKNVEVEYLRLISDELKKWRTDKFNSRSTEMYGKIKTTFDLTNFLSRLLNGRDFYLKEFNKTENTNHKTIVRMTGKVSVRNSLDKILSHPTVGRLHNLHQLSLLYYIYPSAGQSRLDHSLAALGRAQELWAALSNNPTFLFHMDTNAIKRLELAALLHDINHFPFLHYFQEAGVSQVVNAEILDTFLNKKHDQKGKKAPKALSEEIEKLGINTKYLRDIIIKETPIDLNIQDQIIHSIINSGIDIDKLAYLPDDSIYTGVPYGQAVDIFGLFNNIEIDKVSTNMGEIWHLVFSYDALPAIESVCFSRYWNFQRTYWHKTNRAIGAMIIWTIRKIYSREEYTIEDYLNDTVNLGESGALDYLSGCYSETYNSDAPIYGLATDRDLIYKTIFEMSFKEKNELLTRFKNDSNQRDEAQERVRLCVENFLESNDITIAISQKEVLLDVPLRDMDLGGKIFVRSLNKTIVPAINESPVLKALEDSFDQMSKILRVFVKPEIRDHIENLDDETKQKLKQLIFVAICYERKLSEAK